MCLENEHVHERGLAMVEVTDNCNIANHFGERSHVEEEAGVLFNVKGDRAYETY